MWELTQTDDMVGTQGVPVVEGGWFPVAGVPVTGFGVILVADGEQKTHVMSSSTFETATVRSAII